MPAAQNSFEKYYGQWNRQRNYAKSTPGGIRSFGGERKILLPFVRGALQEFRKALGFAEYPKKQIRKLGLSEVYSEIYGFNAYLSYGGTKKTNG
jgi:hypothetical protein